MTLGSFVRFYLCLSASIQNEVLKRFGIAPPTRHSGGTKGKGDHFSSLVQALTNLRNSIAHNNVISDARFSVRNQPKSVTGKFLGTIYGLQAIKFNELVDYVLVMVYLMTMLGYSKTARKSLIKGFRNILITYQSNNRIPKPIFQQVIGQSHELKIKAALRYVTQH